MQPTPLEKIISTVTVRRRAAIGLPRQCPGGERCFALTPEGASMLVESGFDVLIEDDAALTIHYGNEAWARAGATIVDHRSAMACDIVIHPGAIEAQDAAMLRQGAILLTFMQPERQTPQALAILLQRHITAIALDLICDERGHRPFNELTRSVAGRAAMAVGSALLADSIHGKGILLGGVAGVVPCEVMVVGTDAAAMAAARSALGQGATVRMFDNDFHALEKAVERLGGNVIASALHRRVYAKALHTADIVVVTDAMGGAAVVSPEDTELLKRGVIAFDLTGRPGEVFPTLRPIDLAMAVATDCDVNCTVRVCYINAASAVPRTLAMGLTNLLVSLFDRITVSGGTTAVLKLNPGLCKAVYTFMGKPVGAVTAQVLGVRQVDINMYLQFT